MRSLEAAPAGRLVDAWAPELERSCAPVASSQVEKRGSSSWGRSGFLPSSTSFHSLPATCAPISGSSKKMWSYHSDMVIVRAAQGRQKPAAMGNATTLWGVLQLEAHACVAGTYQHTQQRCARKDGNGAEGFLRSKRLLPDCICDSGPWRTCHPICLHPLTACAGAYPDKSQHAQPQSVAHLR